MGSKTREFLAMAKEQGKLFQLYHLTEDIGETRNLAAEHPDRVKEMVALFQQSRPDEASPLRRVERPETGGMTIPQGKLGIRP